MLKEIKEGNYYSVWQNTCYMLRRWRQWEPKSIWFGVGQIPAQVLMPMILALIPKLMIDCVQAKVTVGYMILVVGGMSLAVAGLSWITPFLNERVDLGSRGMQLRYREKMVEKILETDFQQIESLEGRLKQERAHKFAGQYYSRCLQFSGLMVSIGVSFTGIVTYTAILSKVHPLLLLLILAMCGCEFVTLFFYRVKLFRPVNRKVGSLFMEQDYQTKQAERFSAGKDMRLYHISRWFLQAHQSLVKRFFHLVLPLDWKWTGIAVLNGVFGLVRDGAAYAYLIYSVIHGNLDVGEFIFYFGLITGFSQWLTGIIRQLDTLKDLSDECSHYREFLEIPNRANMGAGASLPKPSELPCEIRFEDVSFRYQGAEKNTLEHLNFTAHPGEKIAIVGVNGAGKTTAIKVLCGLYHPTSGRVLVNGVESTAFNRDEYYDLFTAVFQDANLLPLSVAQNVALKNEEQVDPVRLQNCLEQAGLWDHIAQLPEGTKSRMVREVHEDAVDFSGGEQQKLLLARALYKNAPVLVLDEPTAALDPIAENQMYQKYGELTRGKTSFFISHRLSSTRFCDRILFLEDGRIAEEGTHQELMERKGKYYDMFHIQSYYYQEKVKGGDVLGGE